MAPVTAKKGSNRKQSTEVVPPKKIVEFRGALYDERVKSFVEHDWPFRDPTAHTCTPEVMAMAGFMWHGVPNEDPFAKCFACDVEIVVHDFGPETDPWDVHADRSPTCDYLKFRELKFPRDIKFKDIYDIFVKKQTTITEMKIVKMEKLVQAALIQARRQEDEEEEMQNSN